MTDRAVSASVPPTGLRGMNTIDRSKDMWIAMTDCAVSVERHVDRHDGRAVSVEQHVDRNDGSCILGGTT